MSGAPRLTQRGFDRNVAEVPQIVLELVDYLRLHALREPGVFREPGVRTRVAAILESYAAVEGRVPRVENPAELEKYSFNDVASALKGYLRDLDEPLLTFEFMPVFEGLLAVDDEMTKAVLLTRHICERDPSSLQKTSTQRRIKAQASSSSRCLWHADDGDEELSQKMLDALDDHAKDELKLDIQAERCQFVVENLPPGARVTAHCVFRLFSDIAELSEHNHMTTKNLAVCISPSVLYTRSSDPKEMMAASKVSERLCSVLIGRFPAVFPNTPTIGENAVKRLEQQPYNAKIFQLAAQGMLSLLRQDVKDAEKLEKLRAVSSKTGVPAEDIDLELFNHTIGKEMPATTHSRRNLLRGPSDEGPLQRVLSRRRILEVETDAGSDDEQATAVLAHDEHSPADNASSTANSELSSGSSGDLDRGQRDAVAITSDGGAAEASPEIAASQIVGNDSEDELDVEEEAARQFWDDSDDDSYDDMELPDLPPEVDQPDAEETVKVSLADLRHTLSSLSLLALESKDAADMTRGKEEQVSADSPRSSTESPGGLSNAEAQQNQLKVEMVPELKVSYDRLLDSWDSVRGAAQGQSSVARVRTFRDMHKMLDDLIDIVAQEAETEN